MTEPPTPSRVAFAAAVKAHRGGNLQQAEALCRQALQQDGSHAEALHMLGLLALQAKRPAEAVDLIGQAIDRDASNPDYRATLGTALQAQGRLDEAIVQLREALRLQPNSEQFHYNLGNALQQRGSAGAAIHHYHKALQLRPDFVEAQANLGVVRLQQGELDAAVEDFNRALRLNPDLVNVRYKLGQVLHALGQSDAAIACYQEVIRQKPDLVNAHVTLARALTELGELDAAVGCLRQALRRNPDDTSLLKPLSQLLRDTGEFDAAVRCIRKIIQREPQSAEAQYNLGLAMEDLGDLDEALECYRHTLQRNPSFTKARLSEACILEKKGEVQLAYELIEPLVKSEGHDVGVAVLFANLSRQLGTPEDAAHRLETVLHRRELSAKWQIVAHTNLGEVYDNLGRYDAAFAHFRQANELKPGRFDIARHTRTIDDIISTFSPRRMAQLPRAAGHSTLPVFIVGMPRSGTSLVEQILASHPRVYGAGELTVLGEMAESLPARIGSAVGFPNCIRDLDQHNADELAKDYVTRLRRYSSGAGRVTDKMPYNYLRVGLIRLLFPAAPIIHCVRDPRDTCLSCYFSNFLATQTFTNDLQSLADYYVHYIRLMAHWRETLDAPMFEVCYEDLVREPEHICRELLKHLELDWDPRCLQFHQSKRFMNTASYQQVRQPIYTNSVGRWRNYEKDLGPLLTGLELT